MTQLKKFIIDHIDPLGQGVFKKDGEVFFIPKTLPNETGDFEVLRSSKGVNFGKLVNLDKTSSVREKSRCPHFENCNGCAYLHTSIAEEHKFKTSHLKRMTLQSLRLEDSPELITNNKRFSYRNRIQLHYSKRGRTIGFKSAKSNRILPIKNCLLASSKVQEKIKEFTKDNAWIKLIPTNAPAQGHVEFFERDGLVKTTWNQKYADGGFEQVNFEVNQLFLKKVEEIFGSRNLKILDLFGGEGNLVRELNSSYYLSVDLYNKKSTDQNKLNLNLFDSGALNEFKKKTSIGFDTLFVDPPRSGFTNLEQWAQELKPNSILYVSCHPATMFRDLRKISDSYLIEKSFLIDFFPGTKHFEAAIYLTKKPQ